MQEIGSSILRSRGSNGDAFQLLEGLKMEESVATAWLLDGTGSIVRTNCGDEVYFSGQESKPSSLQPPATSHIDQFSNSTSSTLSSATPELHYGYLDPYLQPGHCRDQGSMSQALEQLLLCKDAESQAQSDFNHRISCTPGDWGSISNQQVVHLATSEGPLHQLPGWSQHGWAMEDWQQVSTQLDSSSMQPAATEIQLNHGPWLMEMPGSYNSATLDTTPVNHLFHSGIVSFENHVERQTMNEVAAANRKAARKNRILLRQKSAPHQRVAHASGSGAPRLLEKTYTNKIPREFLMCNHVQASRTYNLTGRNMDPLRFLLHKVLQPSDVSSLGRIIISKKEAETHLPYLAMKDGIFITMEDFDTATEWTFRYRFWPNNKSRMYVLESTGEFVRAHHLKRGDILVLWRNSSRGTFVVRGMMAMPRSRANNPQNNEDKAANICKEEREDELIKGKESASS